MNSAKERPCPVCGKTFVPWRKKAFCSERCRKTAQNRRIRAEQADIADEPKSPEILEQNQASDDGLRRDESPAFKVRNAKWIFSNEITGKLDYNGKPLAWVMFSHRANAWFARVNDQRGQWSCRASNRNRAEQAAENRIRYEPFDLRDGERAWNGDCWRVI